MDVSIYRTAPGDELRQQWLELWRKVGGRSPSGSPLWLRSAGINAATRQTLRLLTLRQDGELRAVLPLRGVTKGRGLLRRTTLRLLCSPLTPGAASALVAPGAEQFVVNALFDNLDRSLRPWDRLLLSGMPTDSVLPAMLFAKAKSVGLASLGMHGLELRRSLAGEAAAPPPGWSTADGTTLDFTDDAAADGDVAQLLRAAGIERLPAFVADAADAAYFNAQPPSQLYVLRRNGVASAAALVLPASQTRYVFATAVSPTAPPAAELALHTQMIARAKLQGVASYRCWCAAPALLFDDQCPLRTVTVTKRSAVNTRNRLWRRAAEWRSGHDR